MATEVVHTVGSGKDYQTLVLWETAQKRDLVSADEIAIAECYGDVGMCRAIYGGWTTDEDHYVVVRAAEEREHFGKWTDDVNFARIKNTDAYCVVFQQIDHIRIERMLIELEQTSGNRYAVDTALCDGWLKIEDCIVKGNPNGGSVGGIHFNDTLGTLYCRNTVVYGCNYNYDYRMVQGTAYIYNCVADGGGTADGFSAASSPTMQVINCASEGHSSKDFNITNAANSDYNISEKGDAPGGNSTTGTLSYVDAANGDFHLSSNDDGGTDLSLDSDYPVSTDIDRATRSATTPDRGVDEYGVAYELVRIVDPGGTGDHLSIVAGVRDFVAGEDWPARHQIPVLECITSSGAADSGDFTTDGTTTLDAIHPLVIRAGAGHEAGPDWDNTKYRFENSINQDALNFGYDYTNARIENIQIKQNQSGRWIMTNNAANAGVFIVDGCHIQHSEDAGTPYGLNFGQIVVEYVVRNSVIDGRTGTGYSALIQFNNCVAIYAYNNTLLHGNRGITIGTGASNKALIVNNVVRGTSNLDYQSLGGASWGSSDYNVSEDATAPGGNSDTSTTLPMVDYDNGDYALSATDGNGLNLYDAANYPFQIDTDGTDRGGAAEAWDRGAHEFIIPDPPVITPSTYSDRNDYVDYAIGQVQFTASDPDAAYPIVWTSNLPAGIIATPSGANNEILTLTGTPTVLGITSAWVRATDQQALYDEVLWTWEIIVGTPNRAIVTIEANAVITITKEHNAQARVKKEHDAEAEI